MLEAIGRESGRQLETHSPMPKPLGYHCQLNNPTPKLQLQLVRLKVVLPSGEEPELATFLEGWSPRTADNPRKEMLP